MFELMDKSANYADYKDVNDYLRSICSDDLDVQQFYPFTVVVMSFSDKIAKGETVELRFEIKLKGNYTDTMYTIRYFQYEGEGTLKLVDGPTLGNNDRVLLGALSYNCGPGVVNKSSILKKLKGADRDIFKTYTSTAATKTNFTSRYTPGGLLSSPPYYTVVSFTI